VCSRQQFLQKLKKIILWLQLWLSGLVCVCVCVCLFVCVGGCVWTTLSFIELTKQQQQAARGGKQHSKLATGNLDFSWPTLFPHKD